MRVYCVFGLFLAGEILLFGQPPSDTLTASVSRSISLMPDQAEFYITVNSDLKTGLDQVVAALPGTGVTPASLVGLSSGIAGAIAPPGAITASAGDDGLRWSFTLSVPFQKMAGIAATLAALQKTIGQNNSGLTLNFQLYDLVVSRELQDAHPCSWSDVMADARALAQKLADAAGLGVGPILTLSDSGSSGVLVGAAAPALPRVATQIGLGGSLLNTITVAPSCHMVATFKLLRYQ